MHIHLIQGTFSKTDATELIGRLIQVKIEFLESKINKSHNEEDIKMREQRIKQLQHELQNARAHIATNGLLMNCLLYTSRCV